MKKILVIFVALIGFGTSVCNSQNVIKSPKEIGKAVTNLIKNGGTMDYADFIKFFVNAEDCNKLSAKSTGADLRNDFLETAKELNIGNRYNGYDNFKSIFPYLEEDGYDLSNLTFVDFWYEKSVVDGVSCIVGLVIMKSNDKYLFADPTAVKTDNGYKLVRLEHKAFNWSSDVTEVRKDGNICGFENEENGCLNFKDALKDLKKSAIRVRMTVR
jgi:hypothetical protein